MRHRRMQHEQRYVSLLKVFNYSPLRTIRSSLFFMIQACKVFWQMFDSPNELSPAEAGGWRLGEWGGGGLEDVIMAR